MLISYLFYRLLNSHMRKERMILTIMLVVMGK